MIRAQMTGHYGSPLAWGLAIALVAALAVVLVLALALRDALATVRRYRHTVEELAATAVATAVELREERQRWMAAALLGQEEAGQ